MLSIDWAPSIVTRLLLLLAVDDVVAVAVLKVDESTLFVVVVVVVGGGGGGLEVSVEIVDVPIGVDVSVVDCVVDNECGKVMVAFDDVSTETIIRFWLISSSLLLFKPANFSKVAISLTSFASSSSSMVSMFECLV